MMSTPSQLGFFDLNTRDEAFSQQGDPLEQLTQVVPWEAFRSALAKVLPAPSEPQGSRPPFDAIGLLKVFVLPSITYSMTKRHIRAEIACRLCGSSTSIWPNAFPMRRRSGYFGKPWRKRASSKPYSSNLTRIWPIRDSTYEGSNSSMLQWSLSRRNGIHEKKTRRLKRARVPPSGRRTQPNAGRKISTPAGRLSMGTITMAIRIM